MAFAIPPSLFTTDGLEFSAAAGRRQNSLQELSLIHI